MALNLLMRGKMIAAGLLPAPLASRITGFSPDAWSDVWYEPFRQGSTSGQNVTAERAVQVTAVFACIRVLAETIASLPKGLFERIGTDGDRQPATDHPLYRILHDEPNFEMTSFEFWELVMTHLALRGNSYSKIEREGARTGDVSALYPIPEEHIAKVGRNDAGYIVYEVQGWHKPGTQKHTGAQRITLSFNEVFHAKGISRNGMTGLSPIAVAREAIGDSLGAMEYSSRVWANDARPGGVLESKGKISPEDKKLLQKDWQQQFTGAGRRKVAILDQELQWKSVSISPDDAQFLETRKFQVTEIARIFRVPPHMIGDLERATFANIEHQAIEFVVHTIVPWVVRLEQAINRSLLIGDEKQRYFASMNVDGLLRGDMAARFEAYAKGLEHGIYDINEIRGLENRNSIKDGDKRFRPGNLLPLDQDAPLPVAPGTPPDVAQRTRYIIERIGELNGHNGVNGHGA